MRNDNVASRALPVPTRWVHIFVAVLLDSFDANVAELVIAGADTKDSSVYRT